MRDVQQIVKELNGLSTYDDYESGVVIEEELKQELYDLGFVACFSSVKADRGEPAYTAITKQEAMSSYNDYLDRTYNKKG